MQFVLEIIYTVFAIWCYCAGVYTLGLTIKYLWRRYVKKQKPKPKTAQKHQAEDTMLGKAIWIQDLRGLLQSESLDVPLQGLVTVVCVDDYKIAPEKHLNVNRLMAYLDHPYRFMKKDWKTNGLDEYGYVNLWVVVEDIKRTCFDEKSINQSVTVEYKTTSGEFIEHVVSMERLKQYQQ